MGKSSCGSNPVSRLGLRSSRLADIWEEVWEMINATFQRIATSLAVTHPTMCWSSGHNDNDAFPFRGYAAFKKSSADEEVVASVDFHKQDDELRFSADIGLDDGRILADGPVGVIKIAAGLATARADIDAAVKDIVRFLEANEPVIRSAM